MNKLLVMLMLLMLMMSCGVSRKTISTKAVDESSKVETTGPAEFHMHEFGTFDGEAIPKHTLKFNVGKYAVETRVVVGMVGDSVFTVDIDSAGIVAEEEVETIEVPCDCPSRVRWSLIGGMSVLIALLLLKKFS